MLQILEKQARFGRDWAEPRQVEVPILLPEQMKNEAGTRNGQKPPQFRERSYINMKHITIGGLDVSRIGLGAMGMSAYYLDPDSSDAESIRTIHRALELGVTHIDTAEIYGPYANEELVGRALEGRRDDVVLATKFGLAAGRYLPLRR